MSNVYLIFSNYVHGRYPETMDLYGGVPGHFHLNGMSDTPKDGENLESLDTLIVTASLSIAAFVKVFQLQPLLADDPVTSHGFSRCCTDCWSHSTGRGEARRLKPV